jgi:hypothetical protein
VLLNLVGEDYPLQGSAAEYDAEQAAAKAATKATASSPAGRA